MKPPFPSSVSPKTRIEIVRYALYTLSLIFGTSFWSTIANKQTVSSCLVFSNIRNGDLVSFSPLCTIFIVFGVILFLGLLILTAWHAMSHFSVHSLPYRVEGCAFAAMAIVWFVLASVAVARSHDNIRAKNYSELRAAVACAFIASFAHGGVSALAFWQARATGKGTLDDLEKPEADPDIDPVTEP